MARLIEKKRFRLVEDVETNGLVFGASMVLFAVTCILAGAATTANVINARSWGNNGAAGDFVDNKFLANVLEWFFPVVAGAMDITKNTLSVIIGGVLATSTYRWYSKLVIVPVAFAVWAFLATISVILMIGAISGLLHAHDNVNKTTTEKHTSATVIVEEAHKTISGFQTVPQPEKVFESSINQLMSLVPINDDDLPSGKTNGQWVELAGGCSKPKKPNRYATAICPQVNALMTEMAQSKSYYDALNVVKGGVQNITEAKDQGSTNSGFKAIQEVIGIDSNYFQSSFSVGLACLVEACGFFGFLLSGIGFKAAKSIVRRREYYTEQVEAPKRAYNRRITTSAVMPDVKDAEYANLQN